VVSLSYPGYGAYVITNTSIDDQAWYAIRAPRDCSAFKLRCSVDIHMRSDPNDATTEDDLPAGMWEECVHAMNGFVPQRFPSGQAVLYVKSQMGATTVYARFID
jgi:hypothetical protein